MASPPPSSGLRRLLLPLLGLLAAMLLGWIWLGRAPSAGDVPASAPEPAADSVPHASAEPASPAGVSAP